MAEPSSRPHHAWPCAVRAGAADAAKRRRLRRQLHKEAPPEKGGAGISNREGVPVNERLPGGFPETATRLSACSSFPGPPCLPILFRDPVDGRVAVQDRQAQRLRGRKRQAGLHRQFSRVIRSLAEPRRKPASIRRDTRADRDFIDLQDLKQVVENLGGLFNRFS